MQDDGWTQFLLANAGEGGTSKLAETHTTLLQAQAPQAPAAPQAAQAAAQAAQAPQAPQTAAHTTRRATRALKSVVTSPVGMAAVCVTGVFVVSLVLLVAIQPQFVKKEPTSKLETEKLSGAKAAGAAAIAAAVTGVVIGIVAAVKAGAKAAPP